MADTIQEVIQGMPAQFNADAAKGMNAVYQYDITGDGGAQFSLEIKDGALQVKEGAHTALQHHDHDGRQDYLLIS
jgi:hypothetical protein